MSQEDKDEIISAVSQILTTHIDQKFAELKQHPPQVNNNINNNLSITNNINITEKIPKCFYSELVDRLGKKNAVNFINLHSAKNDPIKIYQELFPSKNLSENPVLYENRQFKYLDSSGELTYGPEIIDKITDHIQVAMLYASSSLIDESLKMNSTKRLFELYDIGSIQRNVRKVKYIKQQVLEYIKTQLAVN